MRTTVIQAVVVAMAFSVGACATDASEPADDPWAEDRELELEVVTAEMLTNPSFTKQLDEDNHSSLACWVTLLYCADPRGNPPYPSYCADGCTVSQRMTESRALCAQVCGNINCNTMYFLGGC